MSADIVVDDTAALALFRQWREALVLANSYETDVEENDALCERLWAIERQVFDTHR